MPRKETSEIPTLRIGKTHLSMKAEGGEIILGETGGGSCSWYRSFILELDLRPRSDRILCISIVSPGIHYSW